MDAPETSDNFRLFIFSPPRGIICSAVCPQSVFNYIFFSWTCSLTRIPAPPSGQTRRQSWLADEDANRSNCANFLVSSNNSLRVNGFIQLEDHLMYWDKRVLNGRTLYLNRCNLFCFSSIQVIGNTKGWTFFLTGKVLLWGYYGSHTGCVSKKAAILTNHKLPSDNILQVW